MPEFPINSTGAQQIPDNGVDSAAITSYAGTSQAIQDVIKLQRAGLLSQEQLMSLFDKGVERKVRQTTSNEDIQASKARQSLIPNQTSLAQNKISAENSLIQPATQAKIGELGNISALQSGQLELGKAENTKALGAVGNEIALQPGNLAIAKAGQSGVIPEAEFASAEAQQDPTGSLTETRKNFQSLHLGGLIRTPDGKPDYEAMGAANERLAQMRMGQIILPTQQAILDELKKRSPEDYAKAFTNGTLKSTEELSKILSESKPQLNAQEVQSSTSAVIGADAGLSNVTRAREILKQDPDAVGPKYNQGSKVGTLAAQGLAMAGNKAAAKRFDNQKNLNVTLAQGILENIRSLRGTGAIRNTEIAAIERGQPQPDSSVSQWTTWLNQSQDLLERAQRAQKLGLPGPVTRAITPTGPTIQDEPASGPMDSNGNIEKPAAGAKTVVTQSDYDSLPVGSSYLFNGQTRVKTQ